MNIPFDNLYHYIEGRIDRPSVFYLFLPNGSRQIIHLRPLRAYPESELPLLPKIICHDQEPLCWNQYTDDQPEMQDHRRSLDNSFLSWTGVPDWLGLQDLNLDQATCAFGGISIFDQSVLLHSELNSKELMRYQQAGYVPAFWLSHAMIARDWYRYARHDVRLAHRVDHALRAPFLIYSRGFTGTREYRPRFLEYLCEMDLIDHCMVSCLHRENDQDLQSFQPQNPQWRLQRPDRVLSLPECQAPSSSSAEYAVDDIRATACQVVLETKFDGDCLHLTEKTFRALATAQPFLLMAAPGALALLRRYGFETYHGLLDESYDHIKDSGARMLAVLTEMKRLSSMSQSQWQHWRQAAQSVAYRNQARFFSDEFCHMVWQECIDNINHALDQCYRTKGHRWMMHRHLMRSHSLDRHRIYARRPNEKNKLRQLRLLRQGRYIPSQS